MWQEENKQLYRKFEFKDFKTAFEFMTKVAKVAEQQNHHPKWTNEYNKVEVWLTTHSEGKITDKDRALADEIDKIYEPKNMVQNDLEEAKLFTDGGSRGNPGPSAVAFVICKMDNSVVEKSGEYIGETTNNQAEYQALKMGLKRAQELGIQDLIVNLDSELVVKQINGLYKMKNADLRPHYEEVKQLERQFEKITFSHVPRKLNAEADAEVNRILDQQAFKK
jgi:ribonuclease HI/pterin-4a-carbinolamine dehydratase